MPKQKGKLAAHLTYLSPFQKYKIKNSYSEEILTDEAVSAEHPHREALCLFLAESLLDFVLLKACWIFFFPSAVLLGLRECATSLCQPSSLALTLKALWSRLSVAF